MLMSFNGGRSLVIRHDENDIWLRCVERGLISKVEEEGGYIA